MGVHHKPHLSEDQSGYRGGDPEDGDAHVAVLQVFLLDAPVAGVDHGFFFFEGSFADARGVEAGTG